MKEVAKNKIRNRAYITFYSLMYFDFLLFTIPESRVCLDTNNVLQFLLPVEEALSGNSLQQRRVLEGIVYPNIATRCAECQ
jgi:hypothetical protein